jgi:hypothetical protein
MLLNFHQLAYFITRYFIIAKFTIGQEIFRFVSHLHGLLMRYFYDFNCRFICCKVSGAEIYAP